MHSGKATEIQKKTEQTVLKQNKHLSKSSIVLFLSRYASLYFCCAVEDQENELITLEIIHRYVELLDKYFGSVSLTHSS